MEYITYRPEILHKIVYDQGPLHVVKVSKWAHNCDIHCLYHKPHSLEVVCIIDHWVFLKVQLKQPIQRQHSQRVSYHPIVLSIKSKISSTPT